MADEKKKPDVVLSDGTEINFDLLKLSLEDYRIMVNPQSSNEDEDAILEAVAGLEPGSLVKLPIPDWRRLVTKLYKKIGEPLEDPN